MKATNITASRPAAKFSARRSSQAPALPKNGLIVLFPPRPASRRSRARPAGIRELLRGVDLENLLPEAIGQLRFAFQVLGRAPGDRLVGRSLEGFLFARRHALPGF